MHQRILTAQNDQQAERNAISSAIERLEPRTLFATVPTGFADSIVASGLTRPTTMQFAPDGRLFVSQQDGALRIISKDGVLQSTPFLTLDVDATGERGLLGVAFDPNFNTNHYVYVYYTTKTPQSHNRVSRFTANGDVAVAGSEVDLLDLDNLSSPYHNGGAMNFGPDGKLYIATGENQVSANAQSLTSLLGKMLRINSDGSIPTDNPFYNQTTGSDRAIWALGLRNPYTFSFQPGGSLMLIDDVGENTWEEIDPGKAGANYGWPTTEGAFDQATYPNFTNPRYTYDHTQGIAITGGAFYKSGTTAFPTQYAGDYFFTDYGGGWIRSLDLSTNTASAFATDLQAPVDLKLGPDGSLYYLERNAGGRVGKITYTANLVPKISTQPAATSVQEGSPATFSVSATGTGLTYQWQRNNVNIIGATAASYTLNNAQLSDSGAQFQVIVSNSYGTLTSTAAALAVTAKPLQGLTGTYYDNMDFTGAAFTRVDPAVNFNFGRAAPVASMGVDTFSIRWTGQVQAQYSQTYTFYTQSDDGVRLWVNGQQLINNFTDHSSVENSGTIALVAGQKYDIRVDYYENTLDSTVQVKWASPSTAKQIIPQSQLSPTTAVASTFLSADIGGPQPAGSTSVVTPGSAYDVTAGGYDVIGSSDQFRFVYESITGDFDIKVRVDSMSAADAWTKGGLMARESLAANSRNIFALASPTTNRFTTRTATGGTSTTSGSGSASYPNTWLRLRRVGSTFESYRSTNGTTWTLLGSTSLTLPGTLLVGMAVTSHKQGTAATVRFRDLG